MSNDPEGPQRPTGRPNAHGRALGDAVDMDDEQANRKGLPACRPTRRARLEPRPIDLTIGALESPGSVPASITATERSEDRRAERLPGMSRKQDMVEPRRIELLTS